MLRPLIREDSFLRAIWLNPTAVITSNVRLNEGLPVVILSAPMPCHGRTPIERREKIAGDCRVSQDEKGYNPLMLSGSRASSYSTGSVDTNSLPTGLRVSGFVPKNSVEFALVPLLAHSSCSTNSQEGR